MASPSNAEQPTNPKDEDWVPPAPRAAHLDMLSPSHPWLPAGRKADETARISTAAKSPAESWESFRGRVVAGYLILDLLGEGGMGRVFRARQVDLDRIVALKFLRDAGALDEAQMRLQTEAVAIARLQHPNIVQVHEIGNAEGRIFLALEYVPGGSLAELLEQAPLGAREAASLVETLARAMASAHQAGVVHRDLKPGNVLLGRDGTPKISDFGLAKLLRPLDTPDTIALAGAPELPALTQTGMIVGTPSYMAPEQATGSRDIGPAADIYALGALLYECLTGRPPFLAATLLDTLDQVRSREPVPPRRLQPLVPRDLETICLKCLHKEPARRFATAGNLAEDLHRFLAGAPIKARPVSAWERGWKLVRRRPALVSLAAFSAAAVLALVLGALVYQARLATALDGARRQQARAEDNYEKMLHSVDVFLSEVGEQGLEDVPEMEEARARLLQEALRFFRQLPADKDNPDPALRRETGRALYRTAKISALMGKGPQAEADAQEALGILGRLVEEFPGEANYRVDLAQATATLANIVSGHDRAKAEALLSRAVALWESAGPDHPGSAWNLAIGYSTLALWLRDRDSEKSAAFSQGALSLTEARLRDHPEDILARRQLALILLNLGSLQQQGGDVKTAEASYRRARSIWEEVTTGGARVGPAHARLAEVYNNLAVLCAGSGRRVEAEALHQKALVLRRELRRRNPRVPASADSVASTLEALAGLSQASGRPDQVRSHLREAVAIREPLVESHAGIAPYAERLARDYLVLALLDQPKHPADARAHFQKIIQLMEPRVKNNPRVLSYQVSLGEALMWLANLNREEKKYQEALAQSARAVAILEAVQNQEASEPVRLILQGARLVRLQAYQESGGPVALGILDMFKIFAPTNSKGASK